MANFKLEIYLSFIFIRLLKKFSHPSRFVPVARNAFSTSALQRKKHNAKKWRFWPKWREWPDKFSDENILRQGKVLIELSDMRQTCFSSKWSEPQKTIMLFHL